MRRLFLSPLIAAAVSTALASAGHAQSVTSGDASIHYIEAGPASGKTLVLIPGWSCASGVWKKQTAYFSWTMHVVAIDPRSQGESGKTDDGNFPQQRARDYEAVFAALKLKNVILVGWSQGVQDVTSYVAEFGTTRLAGVVLVDAAVSKGAASVSSNPKFVQSVLGNMDIYAKHKRDYLEGMMHAIFSQPMPDADFKALVDTGMKTPTNTGIAELNADMLGADLTPALKKFDKPTLIVASSASFELVGQKAEVSALPHGSFTQIDHAAHGVFVDQPDAFNRILAGFIKKI